MRLRLRDAGDPLVEDQRVVSFPPQEWSAVLSGAGGPFEGSDGLLPPSSLLRSSCGSGLAHQACPETGCGAVAGAELGQVVGGQLQVDGGDRVGEVLRPW